MTDGTTTRPPWLDLDGIASPGLRADMAALTEEIDAMLPLVKNLGRRYAVLARAANDQLPDDGDQPFKSLDERDPLGVLMALTGQQAMDRAMDRLVAHLWSAADERGPVRVTEWLDEGQPVP